jgi:hypothetical protein
LMMIALPFFVSKRETANHNQLQPIESRKSEGRL